MTRLHSGKSTLPAGEELWGTVRVTGPVWQIQGHLCNSWWGEGSHLRTPEQRHFSMQWGEGGRACDIRWESGPTLTPLYNSYPGIRGTSNPRLLPTQKEEWEPFLSDPILKGGAAETLETIKFSHGSLEDVSSGFGYGGRLSAGPTLAGREEGGENNLLSYIHQQTGTYT